METVQIDMVTIHTPVVHHSVVASLFQSRFQTRCDALPVLQQIVIAVLLDKLIIPMVVAVHPDNAPRSSEILVFVFEMRPTML